MDNVFVNETGTPASPQFWEAVFRGTYTPTAPQTSSQVLNVLHFVRQSGPGDTTPALLAAELETQLETALEAAMTDAVSYTSIDVRPMDSPLVPYTPYAVTITGTQSTDSLPSYATVTMRKLTFGRGRNFRGSIHWAGVAEADTEENVLDASGLPLWEDVAVGLRNLINFQPAGATDFLTMAVISQSLSNLTSNPCVFTGAKVSTVEKNTVLGTMRRRKMGVGA